MSTTEYDYIIIGGGLSGLMLAHEITKSPALVNCRVALVERDKKVGNDRTWSFWAKPAFYSPPMEHYSWTHFDAYYKEKHFRQSFEPYQYHSIKSSDYYSYMYEVLDENHNLSRIQDEVVHIDEDGGVVTLASGQKIRAKLVFTSAYDVNDLSVEKPYIALWQHFKGWIIETADDQFDPSTATLMDFRTEQHEDVRFFYRLPYSRRKCLIEYTGFSKIVIGDETYDQLLKQYIRETLGIKDYIILESEKGVIPMTDDPFMTEPRGRIIPIGTQGGYVKASTGYSFTRTVRKVRSLTAQLEKNPLKVPDLTEIRAAFKYRMYDTVFLEVMHSNMHSMDRIFYDLYSHKSKNLIFKFLDEQTALWEDIKVMSACPFDFYKAMMCRVKHFNKI